MLDEEKLQRIADEAADFEDKHGALVLIGPAHEQDVLHGDPEYLTSLDAEIDAAVARSEAAHARGADDWMLGDLVAPDGAPAKG